MSATKVKLFCSFSLNFKSLQTKQVSHFITCRYQLKAEISTYLCLGMNNFLLKHFFEFFEADRTISLFVYIPVVPLFFLAVLR